MESLFYLACIVVLTTAQEEDGPIERIISGRVLGKRLSLFHKQVDAFLGIPFAEPINGQRRFSVPVQREPWEDQVFDATEYGDACWQVTGWKIPQSDDCLNLNVWVPYPRPQNSAVLVWIYGGGFWSGASSGYLYDGKYLAVEESLIVVSMNYRIGSFGFLATGHPSAPGNQGLYDQTMALQWVQDNIAVFGGDPDQVTIFGHSSGGASVSYHMLSLLSRQLFSRAGIQSAGPTSQWAYTNQNEALRRAHLLAEAAGCKEDEEGNQLDIPKCLQDMDASELASLSWITSGLLNFPFVPVYDGVFLQEDPATAMENRNFKHCELLIGSNKNEGSFYLVYYHVPGFYRGEDNLLNFDDYMEALRYSFLRVNSFGLDSIAFQYRPWKTPNDQAYLRDAIDLAVGDYQFTCPSADFAMAYAGANNAVYYYRFEERQSNSRSPEWMGVLHGTEVAYIFGIALDPSFSYTEREVILSRKLMKFWANFAKTGNPNSDMAGVSNEEWPQYKIDSQEYLVLNESLVDGQGYTGSGVKPQQCAFWRKYLPNLVTQTRDIAEIELEWKEQFNKWNTKYIVDWKVQFDKHMAEANCNSRDPE